MIDQINKFQARLFKELKADLTFIDQDLLVQWVSDEEVRL